MGRLVIESWFLLLYCDLLLWMHGFNRVHAVVRRKSLDAGDKREDIDLLCHAFQYACVFYFKPVLCLQRSAATVLLLRRHGRKAEMVIGVQVCPFQSHAWVEVDGHVVNEKPYVNELFQTIERC